MLNIDKDVALIGNKLKTLQLQSVLQTVNARLRPAFLSARLAFIQRVFIIQNARSEFQRDTRVQPLAKPKCEVHVYQPKREIRVSLPDRETRVQPSAKPKCEVHVSLPKRETRVVLITRGLILTWSRAILL